MKIALVAFGGALGAVFRYLIGLVGANWQFAQIPLATTLTNCIGCFLIGVFSVVFISNNSAAYRLLLITGFCGGFTTFSTFALEQKELMDANLWSSQLIHLALNNILGIIFVLLGYYFTSKIVIS